MFSPDNRATPATWAALDADRIFFQPEDEHAVLEDAALLTRLDRDAEDLFFTDQSYYVRAARGLVLPKSFEAEAPVDYGNYFDIAFEAPFRCYSKIEVGRLIGQRSVRAYCLVFDEALIFPQLDELRDDQLLHVPILAVNEMEKAA